MAITPATSFQEPALAWPFLGGPWSSIMAGSGFNPNPGRDLVSASQDQTGKAVSRPTEILIVEDNVADVYLIREAIRLCGIKADTHVAKDGEEAIRYFDKTDAEADRPCPALVILDINLPRRNGAEVLHHLRNSRRCRNAVVIVASTSNAPKDRDNLISLGANAYFHKASDYDEFLKLGDVIQKLLHFENPPSSQE